MPRRDTPDVYEAEMGRPPARLPAEHPDAWQWDYTGGKREREMLLERLGLLDDLEPVIIEGQESFEC